MLDPDVLDVTDRRQPCRRLEASLEGARREPGEPLHLGDRGGDGVVLRDPALGVEDRRVAVVGRGIEHVEGGLAVAVPLQEVEARHGLGGGRADVACD